MKSFQISQDWKGNLELEYMDELVEKIQFLSNDKLVKVDISSGVPKEF